MLTSDMAMRGKKSNFGIAAIRLELLRRATTSAEQERRALSCGGATLRSTARLDGVWDKVVLHRDNNSFNA